jgi:hypothetical protein
MANVTTGASIPDVANVTVYVVTSLIAFKFYAELFVALYF